MSKDYKRLSAIERKPKYANGWLRNCLERAYTQDEWIELFKGLPDAVKIKMLVDLQPKEIKAELASTFRLIVEGTTIQDKPSLPEYIQPDDDVSD